MGATIFLLLVLLQFKSAYSETINIYCGGPYPDNVLSWERDEKYVRGGEIRTTSEEKSHTLRAFPKNKKNCYTIPIGAATKIMVRTRFRYGNYDRRGLPPSFKLLFDGDDWTTVQTKINEAVSYHIIYATRRNWTDICVGRIHEDQDPFVSSIQVSTLEPTMYDKVGPSYALYSPISYAFGAQEIIRFPDDAYDRWWFPIDKNIAISDYETQERNIKSRVNTNTSGDNPPSKLFDSSIVASSNASGILSIRTAYIGTYTREIYLNMYFTEMAEAVGGRTFRVYKDTQPISDVLTVPSGSVLDFPYVTNASGSTLFRLVATADPPPLINGLQIFYIYAFSNRLTNSIDAGGLSLIRDSFSVLENWTGDPCLPVTFNWEWIKCNNDNSPRVTKLYLGGFGLSGQIPDFRVLDALQTIDLQNNNLGGSVPEFFSNFPQLQVLNLADNDFSSIPSALTKSSSIIVNVTGNRKLCEEGKTCVFGPFSSDRKSPLPPTAAGSNKLSSFSLMLFVLGYCGCITIFMLSSPLVVIYP